MSSASPASTDPQQQGFANMDRELSKALDRVHDQADETYGRRKEVEDAWVNIYKLSIGTNKDDVIRKAQEAIIALQKVPELDMSAFTLNQTEMHRNINVISQSMSYIKDNIASILKDVRGVDIPTGVHAYNIAQPNTATVNVAEAGNQGGGGGWRGALGSIVNKFRSQEKRDFQKGLVLMAGQLQRIQNAEERWHTWVMQYQEFVYLVTTQGPECNYPNLLIHIRTFRHVQNVVQPVIDLGLRLSEEKMQDRFVNMSNNMSQMIMTARAQAMQAQGGAPAPGGR